MIFLNLNKKMTIETTIEIGQTWVEKGQAENPNPPIRKVVSGVIHRMLYSEPHYEHYEVGAGYHPIMSDETSFRRQYELWTAGGEG